MDDSCAVCAETLEWVAYGAYGHWEVCSTCVARLRFICNDRHCCICKTESNVVFITKDMQVLINKIKSIMAPLPTKSSSALNTMTAFSEGLILADKSGPKPKTLLDVLDLGAIANPMFKMK